MEKQNFNLELYVYLVTYIQFCFMYCEKIFDDIVSIRRNII